MAAQSNDGSFELKNRKFSHSNIVRLTNNFQTIIGKGGFGTVYYGCLDDTQVSVKMLSPSSIQGHKEFQAEVELLMRVHHKNLTSLVGYCDDGTNMGLIYEFMANGNLETHIIEGDIKNVVGPRLQGDFVLNSAWRAVEVAMAWVSQTSAKRPTMNQVVIDLNESLAIEIGRETEQSIKSMSLNLNYELPPLAR
ncbi:hypothetical protein LWI29_023902 [Acer saccharum]|uniref:Protein kinase domain-containing protein n=1 Tax=Acer saccharum TaxID=4024 RepID=A0AA39SNI0_ACESA|nr:hypothetical protein LWI29_023902 [Acer saccharum]